MEFISKDRQQTKRDIRRKLQIWKCSEGNKDGDSRPLERGEGRRLWGDDICVGAWTLGRRGWSTELGKKRRSGHPAPEEVERFWAGLRFENPCPMNYSHKANENCLGAVSGQASLYEKERKENDDKKIPETPFPDRQLAHHSEIPRVEWQRLSPILQRHFSY